LILPPFAVEVRQRILQKLQQARGTRNEYEETPSGGGRLSLP
jgi:hypothetical protein